jgi:glucose-6-phosphate dehydrogenase assembly protein OpcA
MARSVAAAAERTARRSTPETIEADLATLWRELADSGTPIARAVMSNLIVFRERMAARNADLDVVTANLPLDEVGARHPSRVIVIEHEHGLSTPDAPFAAGVAIVTFGPAQARYGIEEIVVRSACAEASLPSIVRRFIRGDLPTTVWWTEDLSQVPPIDAFVEMGRQLVYDSRRWQDVRRGIAVLAPLVIGRRIDLADLNWRRLAPVRQALPPASAPAGTASRPDTTARIAHRPGEAAIAWLAAGWLLADRRHAVEAAPIVEESNLEEATLSVTLHRPSGDTTVTLRERTVAIVNESAPPLLVGIPIESEADTVAAELRTLAYDAGLHEAIAALVRLFAGTR